MRSVKPEFWSDEDLAVAVCRDARLLYVGLWNLADEHGRLRGDPRYIKGQLLPYDDDLDADAIDALLDELAKAGKLVRYTEGTGRYLFLPNLARHQRLEADKVPSRLPAPPGVDQSAPLNADESESRADESAQRAEDLPLKHGAGGMGQVAGDARVTAADCEPPAKCPKHANVRNPPNCGACAEARRDQARWQAERAARIAAAPKCPIHRGQPLDNCGLCRAEELNPA